MHPFCVIWFYFTSRHIGQKAQTSIEKCQSQNWQREKRESKRWACSALKVGLGAEMMSFQEAAIIMHLVHWTIAQKDSSAWIHSCDQTKPPVYIVHSYKIGTQVDVKLVKKKKKTFCKTPCKDKDRSLWAKHETYQTAQLRLYRAHCEELNTASLNCEPEASTDEYNMSQYEPCSSLNWHPQCSFITPLNMLPLDAWVRSLKSQLPSATVQPRGSPYLFQINLLNSDKTRLEQNKNNDRQIICYHQQWNTKHKHRQTFIIKSPKTAAISLAMFSDREC